MTWYALRAARESVAATRRLLAGASPAAWARLSVLVLFAGGLTTPFLVDFNYGSELVDGAIRVDSPSTALLAASAVAVGLAALLAGSIAEFVLLDALRGDPVRLVARARRWRHAGVQLFVFRLLVFCLLALVGWAAIRVDPRSAAFLALALVAGAIVLLDRITVAFVVPIVFVDGRSLAAGWRAFLPTLRGQWHQYVGYLLVAGTLGLAVAVLGGLLAALVAVAFAVPFSAFGGTVAAALIEQGLSAPTVGRVVVLALAAPYLAVVLGSVLLVHVAPVAYLRYLSLFVLGDTIGRYDPIPRVRAAVRRGGSTLDD